MKSCATRFFAATNVRAPVSRRRRKFGRLRIQGDRNADNAITVVGNVTRDPELKFLNSGQAALKAFYRRQPPLAERPDPGVEERVSYFEVVATAPWPRTRELAHQGRSRDRERSTRTALVGDRERRQAFDRRNQRRRDRTEPEVGRRPSSRAPRAPKAATSSPATDRPRTTHGMNPAVTPLMRKPF